MIQRFVFAAIAAATFGFGPARAEDGFYKGKTIELVLPAAAGGSYGSYGQLVADYLGKHIAGNPTIVPSFMDGGGGMRATNYVANVAPQDGTVILMLHQNAATSQLLTPDAAKYDVAAMRPIGILSAMNSVMVVRKDLGIASVADATKAEVVVGATGRGSYQFVVPAVLNQFFGTKFNIVPTYSGTGETMLALERGEIGAFLTSISALEERQPTWKDGTGSARIILQIGGAADPDLGDVPLLTDIAQTPAQAATFRFLSLPNGMARSLVMAAGVPEAEAETVRAAFEMMVQDPAFLAEAKRLNLPVVWADADAQTAIIRDTLTVGPDVVALAQSFIKDD